jgi:hypothetical protein
MYIVSSISSIIIKATLQISSPICFVVLGSNLCSNKYQRMKETNPFSLTKVILFTSLRLVNAIFRVFRVQLGPV